MMDECVCWGMSLSVWKMSVCWGGRWIFGG